MLSNCPNSESTFWFILLLDYVYKESDFHKTIDPVEVKKIRHRTRWRNGVGQFWNFVKFKNYWRACKKRLCPCFLHFSSDLGKIQWGRCPRTFVQWLWGLYYRRCESHALIRGVNGFVYVKHINTCCGESVECLNVKLCRAYSVQWAVHLVGIDVNNCRLIVTWRSVFIKPVSILLLTVLTYILAYWFVCVKVIGWPEIKRP